MKLASALAASPAGLSALKRLVGVLLPMSRETEERLCVSGESSIGDVLQALPRLEETGVPRPPSKKSMLEPEAFGSTMLFFAR